MLLRSGCFLSSDNFSSDFSLRSKSCISFLSPQQLCHSDEGGTLYFTVQAASYELRVTSRSRKTTISPIFLIEPSKAGLLSEASVRGFGPRLRTTNYRLLTTNLPDHRHRTALYQRQSIIPFPPGRPDKHTGIL